MNPKVDFYFDKADAWQDEIRKLRSILLDLGLTEVLKWGCPAYALASGNVALIHVFKEYCAVLFFKGALLPDAHGMLIQQTENTQATRQMRFTSLREVVEREHILRSYLCEAIEVEKAGLKVPLKKTEDFAVAEEFQQQLNGNPGLVAAFNALTPGRQRAYKLYFAAPKQSKTRTARVEKCIPQILEGLGLDD